LLHVCRTSMNNIFPTRLILLDLLVLVILSAHPGNLAVEGVGLKPLECWDCGFESRSVHGCSSLVFAVCGVDSSLADGLITRSEECLCVCLIVCDLET
jgi:hypothetical protein